MEDSALEVVVPLVVALSVVLVLLVLLLVVVVRDLELEVVECGLVVL